MPVCALAGIEATTHMPFADCEAVHSHCILSVHPSPASLERLTCAVRSSPCILPYAACFKWRPLTKWTFFRALRCAHARSELEAEHDAGDVIIAAARVGCIRKLLGSLLRVLQANSSAQISALMSSEGTPPFAFQPHQRICTDTCFVHCH